ncbi:sugar transferase [Thiosulfatimonas sediminis]|uniref:sugar transferase n=1 Tax=Thiosulfatimonas sediminis TaxID=2675054 RepID=UPI001567B6FF
MKRLFDLTLIFLSLPLLLPVFVVVAVLVRQKLGSPIFFTQTWPGKNAKLLSPMRVEIC